MVVPVGPAKPDTNYAPIFLTVCGIFNALSVAICAARIWTRTVPKYRLRIEDYLIAIATIICFANYFVAVVNAKHGWGHLSTYVSAEDRVVAMKCMFVQMTLWIIAASLIRASVAGSLLRLSESRWWKLSLWTIIILQIITYVGHMLFQLGGCNPIRANWEPVPNVKCWDRKYVLIFGWVSNSLLVVVDFILAIMPIQLIRTLHRSTKEKILICGLMAMGLIASATAAYRMSLSKKTFAPTSDLLSTTVILSMWNVMETLLGIIAACAPCLKAPAEQLLQRVGLLAARTYNMTRPSFVKTVRTGDLDTPPPLADVSQLVDLDHISDVESGKKGGKSDRSNVSIVQVDSRQS